MGVGGRCCEGAVGWVGFVGLGPGFFAVVVRLVVEEGVAVEGVSPSCRRCQVCAVISALS